MRVAGAHALEDDAEVSENADAQTDALFAMHSLARSLRWALRIRLLQLSDVENEAIAAALGAFDEFRRDERVWRARWPRIYDPPPSGAQSTSQTATHPERRRHRACRTARAK